MTTTATATAKVIWVLLLHLSIGDVPDQPTIVSVYKTEKACTDAVKGIVKDAVIANPKIAPLCMPIDKSGKDRV